MIHFGLSNFVRIFEILYSDLKTDIIINGTVKTGYRIKIGVKQGDALSCILFVICIEPLIRNIKNNQFIENINSPTLRFTIPKVYSFADDINALIKNNHRGLQEIFVEYERLSDKSGLVLNAEKTEMLRFCSNGVEQVEHSIVYRGANYKIVSKEMIKINGILVSQDQRQAGDANLKKIIDAMERHLAKWSTRSLSILGKILILKTYAISQMVYYMQTCVLSERNYSALNNLMFKFLWNKNFRAAKAPDRIKRSIVMTPLNLGGFGMIDIKELDRSIKLKGFGRFLTTAHPFLSGLRSQCQGNLDNFFDVKITGDQFLTEATKFVNEDRRKIMLWDDNCLSSGLCVGLLQNLRLKNLLTPTGCRSIWYLGLYRRFGHPKVKDATAIEIRNISMHLRYPRLVRPLEACVTAQGIPTDPAMAYPTAPGVITSMPQLKSSTFRKTRLDEANSIICLYKIGLALTPGEVKNWTKRIRKITSVRHRSLILRIAHGDIYSNSRLHKFGLIDSPMCNNCNTDLETIEHKFITCPKAAECWRALCEIKNELSIPDDGVGSIETVLGTGENYTKLSLALNCELLQLIASQGGKSYHPAVIIKAAIRSILISEPMTKEIRAKMSSMVNQPN